MNIYNGNKIKELREKYQISQQTLSNETGIPKGRINGWEQKNITPKYADYAIIENYFSNLEQKVSQSSFVNRDENSQNRFKEASRLPSIEVDSELYTNKFGNTFIPLEDGRYLMGSPIVPNYAKGGRMAGFADAEYFEELPKHYVVVDRIHRGKYLTFDMIGESMDCDSRDYIAPGARVTAREIKKELWVGSKLHLNDFKDFIIEHVEGLTVKRIIAHDTKQYTITCHSLNEDKEKYPDFDLNLNDVLNLFNIIKVENPR